MSEKDKNPTKPFEIDEIDERDLESVTGGDGTNGDGCTNNGDCSGETNLKNCTNNRTCPPSIEN